MEQNYDLSQNRNNGADNNNPILGEMEKMNENLFEIARALTFFKVITVISIIGGALVAIILLSLLPHFH